MEYEIIKAREPWALFWEYVTLHNAEIGAFGYATPHVNPDDPMDAWLYVDELFLVPQETEKAEVDFITDGLPYAVEKAVQDDRIDDLRFCIHSHYNFGTTFSSTDEDMIRKMGAQGVPWFASVIFNKKGETNARVDMFNMNTLPGVPQMTMKAQVYQEADHELRDRARADIKEFVREKPPVTTTKKYESSKPKQLPAGQTPKQKTIYDANEQRELIEEDSHGSTQFILTEKQIIEVAPGEIAIADALVNTAFLHDWEYCSASDGSYFFFDDDGDYRGSIPPGMDELSIESWLAPAFDSANAAVQEAERV